MSRNVLLLCIRVVRGGSTLFDAVEPPPTRAQPPNTPFSPGGGSVGEGSVRSNLPEPGSWGRVSEVEPPTESREREEEARRPTESREAEGLHSIAMAVQQLGLASVSPELLS